MQVNAFSGPLGVRSELVIWYQYATSVTNGHLLIDLPPLTDDWLRYYTNTGSNDSKLYILDWLKESEF